MIDLTVDPRGVATLILNRPEKHNALSQALIDGLHARAIEIGDRADIRVVVLAGTGPTFCAGGDLGWMQDQIAADTSKRRAAAKSLARMLGALNTLPQPLIGRIHGAAFGGGVGLACICDMVVCESAAKFGLTETKLGLIPATIGPYVAARMGEAHARRVFMSSRVFGAQEAAALGIVGSVVPMAELDKAVAAEVDPYLNCAPQAVAAAKAQLRALGPKIDESIINASIDALMTQWDTNEAKEGISAFFAKRTPVWVAKN